MTEISTEGDRGSRNKYLVFTSAGDHSHLDQWLKGRRNFDLWVTYYGDRKGRYSEVADFHEEHKGSKFQNFHRAWAKDPRFFDHYEAIALLDDDLLMSGLDISRLFELRARYDLWCLQPAFDPVGKISYGITYRRWGKLLRMTNFVEVTCPLFRTDILADFMRVYDPSLVGWGIDWWFLERMARREPGLCGKVAIVDAITCINPLDEQKGGREIDRLQSLNERIANFNRIKAQHGIRSNEQPLKSFGQVRFAPYLWLYSVYLRMFVTVVLKLGLRGTLRRLIREVRGE